MSSASKARRSASTAPTRTVAPTALTSRGAGLDAHQARLTQHLANIVATLASKLKLQRRTLRELIDLLLTDHQAPGR